MWVAVIINPISGARGRPEVARRRAELAAAVLTAEHVEHEVHVTEGPGHASTLTHAAVQREAAVVFAWGGDGTVNEVASALAFGPTALAIIPAGSGNGLARELRTPVKPAQALALGLRAAERAIDVGELGGRLFFSTAGIGLDADVGAQFNARRQKSRGPLPYFVIGLRAIFRYQPRLYTITEQSETRSYRALLIAIANGRQYGIGATIAPQARLDDGALDLIIVEERSPLKTLWDAHRLFTGTLSSAKGVVMRKVQQLTITADEPLLFHVDGEPVRGNTTLEVRLHPRALRIRGR